MLLSKSFLYSPGKFDLEGFFREIFTYLFYWHGILTLFAAFTIFVIARFAFKKKINFLAFIGITIAGYVTGMFLIWLLFNPHVNPLFLVYYAYYGPTALTILALLFYCYSVKKINK